MIKLKSILLENTEGEVSSFEKSLVSKYAQYIEQLHFYYDIISNSIFISDIYIKPQFKGRGFGTKIMNDIIKFGTSLKLPIQLIPASDSIHPKASKRLENFYRKFGFIPNNGNAKFDDMAMYKL